MGVVDGVDQQIQKSEEVATASLLKVHYHVSTVFLFVFVTDIMEINLEISFIKNMT